MAKRFVCCSFENVVPGVLTLAHRSNGARAGEVIGLLINGFVSERYGYRKTMIGALIAMTGFIFILFFAPNVETLVIGEVFCGIPWGM
jgi:SP family general alpha glucoside:H+ symporter-like MFS transporter